MTGRFQNLESRVAKFDLVAVVGLDEVELGVRTSAEMDRGAGTVSQFNVPGEKVGVKMGQEDVFDPISASRRVSQVQFDVSLRTTTAAVLDLSSVIRYEACDKQPR
jgi:hypothetical protein